MRILGVNAQGYESGNEGMCEGRDLPWLQDTEAHSVWVSWHVTFRDVVVVDQENQVIAVFNLTEHHLGDPANYTALKAILREAASRR